MTVLHNNRLHFLAVVCVFAAFLFACSKNEGQQGKPAPDVDVVIVEKKAVANKWDAVGRVDSKDIVQIESRVEGYLIARDFVEGDIVDKGHQLFNIDPKPFEASLMLAKANLAKAEAALVKAKLDLERGQQLYDGKNISKSELDTYTSRERQTAADVAAQKAQVYSAQINLGYTTISAPLKGRIGRTIYSVGNLISPSSGTLATIYSIDPIYVYFNIDEKNLVTYRLKWGYDSSPNFTYRLRLPNGAIYKHEGISDFAQPYIDEDTSTIEVRCVFPNPDNLLLSGMYVSVLVEDKDKKIMPLIPQASVEQGQTGYTVMVVDKEHKVQTRKVELGMRLDAMWVVTKGLDGGETIIVEGLQKVQVGGKVTPHIVTVNQKTGAIIKKKEEGNSLQKTPSAQENSDSDNSSKNNSESGSNAAQKSPSTNLPSQKKQQPAEQKASPRKQSKKKPPQKSNGSGS